MFCRLPKRWMLLEYKHYLNHSNFCTATKEKWDLVSSICLERKPIITKNFTDIELKYSELVHNIEYEMSHKSDHEIRKLKDLVLAEQLKKDSANVDMDKVGLQTAQEFEDVSDKELKDFAFANRTTNEDIKCDVTSTNRMLSNSLLLIIKQNIGNKSIWVLPQGIREDGETMRQAAERVLKERCGHSIQAKFLGNAPCGFYKYKYPKSANVKSSVGMKIFFYKAQLIKGNVSKEFNTDFQWLPQKELSVLQEDYLKSVKMFLVDDEIQVS